MRMQALSAAVCACERHGVRQTTPWTPPESSGPKAEAHAILADNTPPRPAPLGDAGSRIGGERRESASLWRVGLNGIAGTVAASLEAQPRQLPAIHLATAVLGDGMRTAA